MKLKKLSAVLVVMLVLSLVLAGCAKPVSQEESSETKTDEVVKVGWVGALTGEHAVWGTAEFNAAKLYFDNINKNGGLLGKKIEVVGYDTKGDLQEAVNVVKRLVGQDKVIAVLGPNSSGSAISISAVLDEMKIPCISTVASNPKVTVVDGKLKPFMFRTGYIDPYQGLIAAGFAYEELNAKTGAVLYDVGDDYSQGFSEFIQEGFAKKGGKIVAIEGYKSGDVDFRAQLTKIKATNPDVLFMPILFKDVALASKQARELGMEQVFIGGDGWPSDQLITMAGDAVEGSYFVNHVASDDPDVQTWRKLYEDTYKIQIEVNGFVMHDSCLMLEDAIKRANSFDPIKIKDALETTSVQGITGKIVIGKDTHNPENKDTPVIKIENGKFKFVRKYKPE